MYRFDPICCDDHPEDDTNDIYMDVMIHNYNRKYKNVEYNYKTTTTVWLDYDAYPYYETVEEYEYYELNYFDASVFKFDHRKNIDKRSTILENKMDLLNNNYIHDKVFFSNEKIWLSLTIERYLI